MDIGGDNIYDLEALDNLMLHDPISLPRYGHLARKVMAHYLGDSYAPGEDTVMDELFLRSQIQTIIGYKVLYRRKSYDWEWIDQSFRHYFSAAFNLPLEVDMAKLEAGLNVESKAPVVLHKNVRPI